MSLVLHRAHFLIKTFCAFVIITISARFSRDLQEDFNLVVF